MTKLSARTRSKRWLYSSLTALILTVGGSIGVSSPASADITITQGSSVLDVLYGTQCLYNTNCWALSGPDYCAVTVSPHYAWFYYNRYDWVEYCWYNVWN